MTFKTPTRRDTATSPIQPNTFRPEVRPTAPQCMPILLLGPSTVGKSELAFALAERLGGEIINADKFYLFSGFPFSTGLPDFRGHPTIPVHLYQFLSPETAPLEESEYGRRAASLVHAIVKRGAVPIVEGCYHRYARAVLSATADIHWNVVGIRWSPGVDVPQLAKMRVKHVYHVRHGIEEVRSALQRGYRESYVMRCGSMVRPIVEYLDGLISLEAAEDKAVVEILAAAYKALRRFLDFPSVTWFAHDAMNFSVTMKSLTAQIHEDTGHP